MHLPFLVVIAALVVGCVAADDNITCSEVVKAFNSLEDYYRSLWDTANSIDTDAEITADEGAYPYIYKSLEDILGLSAELTQRLYKLQPETFVNEEGKDVYDAHRNCSVSEKDFLAVLSAKGPKVVQKTPALSERTVEALRPLVDSNENLGAATIYSLQSNLQESAVVNVWGVDLKIVDAIAAYQIGNCTAAAVKEEPKEPEEGEQGAEGEQAQDVEEGEEVGGADAVDGVEEELAE